MKFGRLADHFWNVFEFYKMITIFTWFPTLNSLLVGEFTFHYGWLCISWFKSWYKNKSVLLRPCTCACALKWFGVIVIKRFGQCVRLWMRFIRLTRPVIQTQIWGELMWAAWIVFCVVVFWSGPQRISFLPSFCTHVHFLPATPCVPKGPSKYSGY